MRCGPISIALRHFIDERDYTGQHRRNPTHTLTSRFINVYMHAHNAYALNKECRIEMVEQENTHEQDSPDSSYASCSTRWSVGDVDLKRSKLCD